VKLVERSQGVVMDGRGSGRARRAPRRCALATARTGSGARPCSHL
jgi:hypothetical protein